MRKSQDNKKGVGLPEEAEAEEETFTARERNSYGIKPKLRGMEQCTGRSEW